MRSCCKALWIKVDYLLLHILAATVSDSGLPLPVSPSPAPPRMSLRPIHYTCPPSDSRFWISWWNCVLGSDLHVFLYLSLDPGVRLWLFVVLTCLSLPPEEDILHPPPDIHWSWWSLICSVLTWFRLPSKNPSSLTWPGPQSQSPYSTALYLTPLTVYHSPGYPFYLPVPDLLDLHLLPLCHPHLWLYGIKHLLLTSFIWSHHSQPLTVILILAVRWKAISFCNI